MYIVRDSRGREVGRYVSPFDAMDYMQALLLEGKVGRVEFDAEA